MPKPVDEGREETGLRSKVLGALRTIYDPELPVNIYDLGLVYALDIDAAGHVDIRMTLTAPGCPVAQSFPAQVEQTVSEVVGRERRPCRNRLGSALGSKPHDRGGAAATRTGSE